jgi:uncharacterized protein YutE (UPF0331/DUF86 family)
MDPKSIFDKLGEFDSFLLKIEEYLPTSFEEYESDEMRRRAIERLLFISIQCTMDISGFVVNDLKLGIPSNEEDILNKLVKKGVISSLLAEKLKGMRKLRDQLFYWYSKVNDAEVFEGLTSNLNDLKEFSKQVKKVYKRKIKI